MKTVSIFRIRNSRAKPAHRIDLTYRWDQFCIKSVLHCAILSSNSKHNFTPLDDPTQRLQALKFIGFGPVEPLAQNPLRNIGALRA